MHELKLRIRCMLIHCQPTLADLLQHFLDKTFERGRQNSKLPSLIRRETYAIQRFKHFEYETYKSKAEIDPKNLDILEICELLMSKQIGLMKSVKCCEEKCYHECLTCTSESSGTKDCQETVECYKKHCLNCGSDAASECIEQVFLKSLSLIQTVFNIAKNIDTDSSEESSEQGDIFEKFEKGEQFQSLKNYKNWSKLWQGIQRTMAKILEYLNSMGNTSKDEWKDRDMEMRIVLKKSPKELVCLNEEKLCKSFGCIDGEEERRAYKECRLEKDNRLVNSSEYGHISNLPDPPHTRMVSRNDEASNKFGNNQVSLLPSSQTSRESSRESSKPENVYMNLEKDDNQQRHNTVVTPGISEQGRHNEQGVNYALGNMAMGSSGNAYHSYSPGYNDHSGSISQREGQMESSSNGAMGMAIGTSPQAYQSYSPGQWNRLNNFGSMLAQPIETNEEDVKAEVAVVSDIKSTVPMYSLDNYKKFEWGKHLVLIRGLPGSGRTTLARRIAGMMGKILATDDFFWKNGKYAFDGSRLPEAHEWNQQMAENEMKIGSSPICIDNTNLQAWEMKAYVLLALKYKYAVDIQEVTTPWADNPKECAKKTFYKDIKEGQMKGMLKKYKKNLTVDDILNSNRPPRKST